jgi:hypothetical protein
MRGFESIYMNPQSSSTPRKPYTSALLPGHATPRFAKEKRDGHGGLCAGNKRTRQSNIVNTYVNLVHRPHVLPGAALTSWIAPYLACPECARYRSMDTNPGVKSQTSLENSEDASADRRETLSDLPTRPYVIARENTAQLERCDLQNASNAIQMSDERSRHQQCKCEWDYATANGIQRAHNPLCPVHDPEPVLDVVGTQLELNRK